MGRLWNVEERLMRDQWHLMMKLIDALVKSIITYEAELWGWSGYKELEFIQKIYKIDAEIG